MRVIPWIFVFALVGCGAAGPDLAQTKYRVGNSAYAGLTRRVAQPVVRVCYSDRTNSEIHKEDVRYSILEWVDALREVTTDPLAEEVEILASNDVCDVKVFVGNYSPAFTRMGSTPEVYVNYSGWFGSKTVTLHEFGHAFGLLDTYNGSGGSCQSGQPDSVMCRASYDELQDDDTAGVRRMYEMVQSGLLGSHDPVEPMIVF